MWLLRREFGPVLHGLAMWMESKENSFQLREATLSLYCWQHCLSELPGFLGLQQYVSARLPQNTAITVLQFKQVAGPG